MKTVEEHLKRFVWGYKKDCDERLPVFSLAYRASKHETTGTTHANTVFGRGLRLPCNLLLGASPDKGQSPTNYVTDLVDRLHDIDHYARKLIKAASDGRKVRYDRMANSAGFQEGECVWFHHSTRSKRKTPKHQPSWDCPSKVKIRISDVVCRNQRRTRAKMMVVDLDRLAPHLGTSRDKQPERETSVADVIHVGWVVASPDLRAHLAIARLVFCRLLASFLVWSQRF